MENVKQELVEIFNLLKECQSQIFQKEENSRFFEPFALCAGAFFRLHQYQEWWYGNLQASSHIPMPHDKNCWSIFREMKSYSEFTDETKPPKDKLSSELHSMTLADASFRISSAGVLISKIIKQGVKGKKSWPYHNFLNNNDDDWDRGKIFCEVMAKNRFSFKNMQKTDYSLLLLVIALRDEYGHSELFEHSRNNRSGGFSPNMRYKECRKKIIEHSFYKENILEANISIMKKILRVIKEKSLS